MTHVRFEIVEDPQLEAKPDGYVLRVFLRQYVVGDTCCLYLHVIDRKGFGWTIARVSEKGLRRVAGLPQDLGLPVDSSGRIILQGE